MKLKRYRRNYGIPNTGKKPELPDLENYERWELVQIIGWFYEREQRELPKMLEVLEQWRRWREDAVRDAAREAEMEKLDTTFAARRDGKCTGSDW